MVHPTEHCCDFPSVSLDNKLQEFALLVSAIDELGTKGEKSWHSFFVAATWLG